MAGVDGLTRRARGFYSRGIATTDASSMHQTIHQLERRIGDLIRLTEALSRENESLRADSRMLRQEFKSLQEKTKIADNRVGQIIARLQSMRD